MERGLPKKCEKSRSYSPSSWRSFFDLWLFLIEYPVVMLRKYFFRGLLLLLLVQGLFSCSHTATTAVYDFEDAILEKECIAIFPFDNLSQYPNAGRIASDIMATSFYRSGKFRLMERNEVERISQLSRVHFPRKMDTRFARSLGKALQVEAVLIGSVTEYAYLDPTVGNPGVSFSVNLIDVETGRSLWVASHSRTSKDHFQYKKDPINGIAMLAIDHMTAPLFRRIPARDIQSQKVCGNSQAIMPPAAPSTVEASGPNEGILAGRTLKKNGQVLGSVIVEFPNRGISRLLTDPETGGFKVDRLAPGTIRIVAKKEGYKEAVYETQIKAGKMEIIDLELAPSLNKRKRKRGTVTGKVLDIQGKPLKAAVFLKSKNSKVDLKANTNDKGRFFIKMPPGTYNVRVIARGFITQNKKIKVENKSKVILNINMHPERGV